METKRKYEAMLVINPASASSNWNGVIESIKNIFNRYNAEFIYLDKWDERKLFYPIKGHNRAVYVLAYFTAPQESIVKIKRDLYLNENVLRVLILRKKNIPEMKEKDKNIKAEKKIEENKLVSISGSNSNDLTT